MTNIDVKVFQRFQKYKPVTDKQLSGQLRLTNRVKFQPFHAVTAWFCFTLLDSKILKVCRNKQIIVQIKVPFLGGTSVMFKTSYKKKNKFV